MFTVDSSLQTSVGDNLKPSFDCCQTISDLDIKSQLQFYYFLWKVEKRWLEMVHMGKGNKKEEKKLCEK